MTDTFQIRSYQPGDDVQILDLFHQCYGHDLGKDYWAWRFQGNPAGSGIIDMTWDGAIPAAHYAVTPAAFRIHGGDWLTGLSGTTMTHPNYRGRGLFPVLARNTYTRMTAMGMAMVWGFPNTLSHRGFVRDLTWVDICEAPIFRLQLTPRASKLAEPGQVMELREVDDRFDRLWTRVRDDYAIIGQRDAAHVRWRYLSNPVEKYRLIAYVNGDEIQGYAIFKRYDDELQVIDLLVGKNDVEVGDALMAFVTRDALSQAAASIGLWLNLTHPLHHALEKIGFKPEGSVTYMGGLALQPQFDRSLYDFRDWYYTMGDSDVF